MKKHVTELVFILDRSGSMSGLESDTISSFNSMIEKQKKQNGDCHVYTVLFDNERNETYSTGGSITFSPLNYRSLQRYVKNSCAVDNSLYYRFHIVERHHS